MKVLQVATVGLSVRLMLRSLIVGLGGRGFDVVAVSAGPGESGLDGAMPCRHVEVPLTRRMTPLEDLRALWRLLGVLKSEKPLVLHTHTPKANLLGQVAGWLCGVPVRVCTIHGLFLTPHMGALRRAAGWLLEAVSARFAHTVFFVNEMDLEKAVRLGICRRARARLLPGGMGVDLNRFDPASISNDEKESLRRELSLPSTGAVVGFVGRLVREKGVLDLIAAVGELRSEGRDVHLLLVGPVDREKADFVDPMQLQPETRQFCTFAGMRSDIPAMLLLMDILALPSYREGFALTLAEAASMGVPVVATRVSGCLHSVEEGGNGLLVEPGDRKGLAIALHTLLDAPDMRSRMAARGRELAAERFDAVRMVEITAAVYEELAAERAR